MSTELKDVCTEQKVVWCCNLPLKDHKLRRRRRIRRRPRATLLCSISAICTEASSHIYIYIYRETDLEACHSNIKHM